MRPILAGQAAYGEKNRGHALLGASRTASRAADVVNQMDIQGTPPPGVEWAAHWSGLPLEDAYVLARTAPDLNAGRLGMVRTRALFIPVAELQRLDDLSGAMEFLLAGFDDQGPYQDVELATGARAARSDRGLAEALLTADEGVTVWPFAEGFEEALQGLWENLWPEARQALSFRLAFSPSDIADNTPVIVATLPSLVSRWAGYHQVKSSSQGTIDAGTALLLGDPASAPLRATMVGLDAAPSRIADLRQIVAVNDALTLDLELSQLIAALRRACFLSPDPKTGSAQKNRLAERCAAAMPEARDLDVRMARNMDLAAVADASAFWNGVRVWAGGRLWAASPTVIEQIIRESGDEDGPVAAWRLSIRSGIADFLRDCQGRGAVIWRLVTHAPSLVEEILGLAPSRKRLEVELLDTLPRKITAAAAEPLLNAFAQSGSMGLHAGVCSASFTPVAAAKRHLHQAADDGEVGIAVARATDAQLVEAALANSSDRLYDLAAHRAAVEKNLLQTLDVSMPSWRRLWRVTLGINPGTWDGPTDARSAMETLLNAFVDQTYRDEELLAALSASPLANVIDYPRRQDLWRALPPRLAERLLAATVDAWSVAIGSGSENNRPEPELAAALLDPARMRKLLDQLVSKPVVGCQVFGLFSELDQPKFLEWLARVLRHNRSLANDAAEGIGRVVAVRSWNDTAKELGNSVLDGRRDLRPAIEYCVDQVSWLMRYRLDIPSTSAAKWRILEEIGVELYPIGPGQDHLWVRAGGQDADIPRVNTGREAWHIVVHDLENGRRKVPLDALVREMADDHRSNPTLAKMREDRFFR